MDVRVKLEEQNRNQLTFGAGVSQYEGFFGQLSFQTSNFLGRGESFTVSLQAGSLAQNYTIGFTEPFLFDRNMTGGVQVFKQEIHYVNQFTQNTTGGTLTFGVPARQLHADVRQLQLPARHRQRAEHGVHRPDRAAPQSVPAGFAADRPGRRARDQQDHAEHRAQHGGQSDFPDLRASGYTAANDLAGLGGNTNFYKPNLEGVCFWKQNPRMSLGMRGQLEYIHQFSGSAPLPIFEQLFLGGEYSVRGFDIRSIGPSDPVTGLVLGGNKSLLFNLEQGDHDCRPGPGDPVLRCRARCAPGSRILGFWEPVLQTPSAARRRARPIRISRSPSSTRTRPLPQFT